MKTWIVGIFRIWWVWALFVSLIIGLIIGLVVFKPWLIFIDVEVGDSLPVVASPTRPTPSEVSPQAPETGEETVVPSEPVLLSSGEFVSHEHSTTGTAQIIKLPNGHRQLALSNLSTTNGPDVHVWLSAGPVVEGRDGWYTAGGHDFIDLGLIKGNLGDQLYDIPDDIDLSRYPTVDLWCVQFGVSFGAAALTP